MFFILALLIIVLTYVVAFSSDFDKEKLQPAGALVAVVFVVVGILSLL
jgi:hypothetical protein